MEERLALTGQKYLECFCRRSRDGFFVRYADPALPDMYCHNFLELKRPMGERVMRKTLEERLEGARKKGQLPFFRLELDFDPASVPDAFPEGGEAEHNGIYALVSARSTVEGWRFCPECTLRQMTERSDAEALAQIDLSLGALNCSRDFCLRRAERKTRVYISGGPCRNYLAEIDGQAVGTCTLFEYRGVGKLEDLAVCADFRHRAVALTLLRALVLTALDDGCDLLSLTADEDDTVKELYRALGFEKICDRWALTWRL